MKDMTQAEIIKTTLGKKFKVKKVDDGIKITNKSTKRIMLIKVEIIGYGGTFGKDIQVEYWRLLI